MYKSFFKRFLDFCAATLLFVALLPIFVPLVIILFFYYKGNPLFYQKRPGYKGVIFSVIKLKSMVDAYDNNGNPLPDSVRLTKMGKFLRRTSLDELPQLLNVIRGDMSFIGPRPLLVRYLPYYTQREQLRHNVRPGITGLAQVSGRNNIGWNDRLELDARYVENLSFMLDIEIALKTVVNVLSSKDIAIIPGDIYQPLDVERKV